MPNFFMMTQHDLWLKVNENTTLLDAVRTSDLTEVAAMSTLRKSWNIDEIRIAATLLEARAKAQEKLENSDSILADTIGVQQASSSDIARHKAKRFQTDAPIFDLCCGVGSDLRALPDHAIGVDIDPLRSWMAKQNSARETRCEDVLTMTFPPNTCIHIDPSRRDETKRLHSLDTMKPSFEEVCHIAAQCIGGCIKVSPSVNIDDIGAFPHPFELEYIEEKGRVVQGLIWFGSLAHHVGQTTATSMSKNLTYSDESRFAAFDNSISGYILEPNPALERSGLHQNIATSHDACELSPNLGLFCIQENPNSPWFTSYEILATTPLRLEKVKSVLTSLQCTQVEVKTRDKTIDPNEWQNKLTSKSRGPLLTIFALRVGKKRIVAITRRLPQQ